MKNAIILHGRPDEDEYYDANGPSCSNYHWLPWLQKQLLVREIAAYTPEVPHAFRPRWATWVKEVERFEIGPETMLVGHSCGGGFWVRYLSEHPDLRVGKVVLVAPWINPDNDQKSDTADFFEFEIDADLVSRTASLTVFYSDNEYRRGVPETVKILREKLHGGKYREFHNYGHFCIEDMPSEFPELLEELLS